jgi:hypothetical protein
VTPVSMSWRIGCSKSDLSAAINSFSATDTEILERGSPFHDCSWRKADLRRNAEVCADSVEKVLLNRVQSSRRLEREAGRNLEVMWLTGRLAPDHKTIADFRRDNGSAIEKTCAQFVELQTGSLLAMSLQSQSGPKPVG